MNYISTRGGIEPIGFREAVRTGLADDGGLIIPQSIPDLRGELADLAKLDYPELALRVMQPFVGDISSDDLRRLVERTYGEAFDPHPCPLVRVGELWMMELWHGPTLAFKDIALQWLGNLFERLRGEGGEPMTVLGATSGDTGSAAIHGCRNRDGLEIFIMHPRGGVSEIQRLQMTTVDDANVHNLALDGSFDDCQAILKQLFGDLDFKRRHNLAAVNSVNWARVLAQTVYYFYGAFRVCEAAGVDRVRAAVPTGNFGDILAGWYARAMGAPIDRLILATNENDILYRFFQTGRYERGQVRQTLAPAMDIQVASNFERYLYYRLGESPEALRDAMASFAETGCLEVSPGKDGRIDGGFFVERARRMEMLEVIGRYRREHEYLLDPHTSAGVFAAEQAPVEGDEPTLCLATAHPAKFPDAIAEAIGDAAPASHPTIDALRDKPTRCDELPADPAAVRSFIEDKLKKS